LILSDLKRYLQERGQASLWDMALHFDAEPDVVRAMLDVWVRKGRVQRDPLDAACGGNCNQCDMAASEIYRWTGEGGGGP
jgi:hypothetical protein